MWNEMIFIRKRPKIRRNHRNRGTAIFLDFDSYRKWGGKDPRSKIANEANILLEGVKCEIDRLPCRIEVPATLNIWVGWAPESDDLPASSRPEGRGRVVVIGWDVEPSIASVWGGIFGDEGL